MRQNPGDSSRSRRGPGRALPPPTPVPSRAERAAHERARREAAGQAAGRRAQREQAAREDAVRERARRSAELGGRAASRSAVRRTRRLVVLGVVSLLVLGGAAFAGVRHFSATGGGPAGASSPSGPKGRSTPAHLAAAPIEVGVARCVFVDRTRSTHNFLTGATTPDRRLVTEIRYPTVRGSTGHETAGARPLPHAGGYPVVYFAEGFNVVPGTYRPLLDAWVRSGFVVVAPIFPDTNPTAVAEEHSTFSAEDDNVNEPGDIAFVTRQVTKDARAPERACRVLDGLVAPDQAVLAGQSDGGNVVAALAYDNQFAPLLAGLSYHGVAVLSGAEFPSGGYTAGPDPMAMLVVQSDADACNVPIDSALLYNAVPITKKWFLLLHGVYHLDPYNGRAPAAFSLVAAVTTRWFRLELADATPGAGFLSFANRSPAVGRLSTGPAAPKVPELAFSQAACYFK